MAGKREKWQFLVEISDMVVVPIQAVSSQVLRQLENKGLVKWQVATTERLMSNGIPVPSLDKAQAQRRCFVVVTLPRQRLFQRNPLSTLQNRGVTVA